MEAEVSYLLSRIQASASSNRRRRDIANHLLSILHTDDLDGYVVGSRAINTYLPDGGIDLALIPKQKANTKAVALDAMKKLCDSMDDGTPFKAVCGPTSLKSVEFVSTREVHCVVNSTKVNITVNQTDAISAAAFLEEVDRCIGCNHIFKRSVILIKAWCNYESSSYCRPSLLGSAASMLSSHALNVLVLVLFNHHSEDLLIARTKEFSHPFQILRAFLHYYGWFDWDRYAVTLDGPVELDFLRNKSACGFDRCAELNPRTPNINLGKLKAGKNIRCLHRFDSLTEKYRSNLIQSQKGNIADPDALRFPVGVCNIIDPLNDNNNLGLSVSSANISFLVTGLQGAAHHVESLMGWDIQQQKFGSVSLPASDDRFLQENKENVLNDACKKRPALVGPPRKSIDKNTSRYTSGNGDNDSNGGSKCDAVTAGSSCPQTPGFDLDDFAGPLGSPATISMPVISSAVYRCGQQRPLQMRIAELQSPEAIAVSPAQLMGQSDKEIENNRNAYIVAGIETNTAEKYGAGSSLWFLSHFFPMSLERFCVGGDVNTEVSDMPGICEMEDQDPLVGDLSQLLTSLEEIHTNLQSQHAWYSEIRIEERRNEPVSSRSSESESCSDDTSCERTSSTMSLDCESSLGNTRHYRNSEGTGTRYGTAQKSVHVHHNRFTTPLGTGCSQKGAEGLQSVPQTILKEFAFHLQNIQRERGKSIVAITPTQIRGSISSKGSCGFDLDDFGSAGVAEASGWSPSESMTPMESGSVDTQDSQDMTDTDCNIDALLLWKSGDDADSFTEVNPLFDDTTKGLHIDRNGTGSVRKCRLEDRKCASTPSSSSHVQSYSQTPNTHKSATPNVQLEGEEPSHSGEPVLLPSHAEEPVLLPSHALSSTVVAEEIEEIAETRAAAYPSCVRVKAWSLIALLAALIACAQWVWGPFNHASLDEFSRRSTTFSAPLASLFTNSDRSLKSSPRKSPLHDNDPYPVPASVSVGWELNREEPITSQLRKAGVDDRVGHDGAGPVMLSVWVNPGGSLTFGDIREEKDDNEYQQDLSSWKSQTAAPGEEHILFYNWYKVEHQKYSYVRTTFSPALSISNVEQRHAGEYRAYGVIGDPLKTAREMSSKVYFAAEGTQRAGIAGVLAVRAAVRISKPPQARNKLQYIEVTEGSRLFFQLKAMGTPPPAYTWYRNGVPVNTNGETVSSSSNQTNVSNGLDSHNESSLTTIPTTEAGNALVIEKVTTAHSGTYTCKLTNIAGSHMWTEATVSVKPLYKVLPPSRTTSVSIDL
jgi:hypothetical protein